MKIIINTINIYHIHDNSYNTCGNQFKANKDKMDDADLSEFSPAIIVNDNLNKSGIYLLTNLITSDIYVGQSINLGKRLGQYLTLSYLKDRNNLIISKALIKYGYINFYGLLNIKKWGVYHACFARRRRLFNRQSHRAFACL